MSSTPFPEVEKGWHQTLVDLNELSLEQSDSIRRYKERTSVKTSAEVRNPKRKRRNECVQLAEKSYNEENFPLESSCTVPVKECETSGYVSRSSSNASSTPEFCELPEQMKVDCNSTAQPPEGIETGEVGEGALILMDLKNGPSAEVRNPKRKRRNESVQLAEKSYDNENFPLKSSCLVPVKECETCGYVSRSSSDASTTHKCCELPEQKKVDCNSGAQPPKGIKTDEVEEAARILMGLKDGPNRRNEYGSKRQTV